MWDSCFLAPTRGSSSSSSRRLLPPPPPLLTSSIIHIIITLIISSSSHLIILSHHLVSSSYLIISSHHVTPLSHLIISSSHHLIISSSHHLIISSSHHLIISSSHHLIISSSHHLIISSSHHLIISSSHHLIISSSHHLISITSHHTSIDILTFHLLFHLCSIFCFCGRRSTWSLQKGLRRAWSPWAAAPVCVAGAVLGACRKGCGAPGHRGPRLLSVWQAQYLEPSERVAARLVAVGRGCCLYDRRSTWILQKGLRRAWSPWAAAPGRRSTWSLQKGLRRAWSPWAAAAVCAAGAVFGASRKGLAACCV